MKQLLTILLLGLCLVACNRHSEHWKTITDMERIIEERPDSVLNVLQAIDTDKLVGDEERAKHALLLSMALDKNVIDKTDFEVLQPAIDYYQDNGSATDKLRTYYYQGRIYQNAGNDAMAMEAFVKALSKGSQSNDILTKARTHFAQSNIYYDLYDFDNFIATNKSAAAYFKQAEDYNGYADCFNRIINGYTLKDEPEKALPYIDECKQMLDGLSIPTLTDFYSSYITYLTNYGTEQEIDEIIHQYTNSVPSSNVDWLTIANAYYAIHRYNEALSILSQYDTEGNEYKEKKYLVILYEVYRGLGDYKNTLETFEEYVDLFTNNILVKMQQDTKFVEERHALEMAKAKETEAKNKRTIAVLACVVALIGSLLVIMIIRRRLQISHAKNKELEVEKQKYEQLYADAIAERDALTKMVEDSSVKAETKAVIKARLDVLNKVIISQITGTTSANKKAYEELELLLADKETFIESTRLTIEGNNPEFITALKRRGLTDEEINICCLYAIGLKGKDIKAYTSQPRHYNQSADIRHKLGLTESDTNLSIFICDMLEK
ncbi:MAG: hypothetical protein IKY67_09630 [Paludibacteraceae bacterium]|nr:hypothetical protein [Paludibacteraceae bacterium]